eukprot:COSAG05_NODE_1749_length_4148_cov_2.414423_1_plen_291_part_00
MSAGLSLSFLTSSEKMDVIMLGHELLAQDENTEEAGDTGRRGGDGMGRRLSASSLLSAVEPIDPDDQNLHVVVGGRIVAQRRFSSGGSCSDDEGVEVLLATEVKKVVSNCCKPAPKLLPKPRKRASMPNSSPPKASMKPPLPRINSVGEGEDDVPAGAANHGAVVPPAVAKELERRPSSESLPRAADVSTMGDSLFNHSSTAPPIVDYGSIVADYASGRTQVQSLPAPTFVATTGLLSDLALNNRDQHNEAAEEVASEGGGKERRRSNRNCGSDLPPPQVLVAQPVGARR